MSIMPIAKSKFWPNVTFLSADLVIFSDREDRPLTWLLRSWSRPKDRHQLLDVHLLQGVCDVWSEPCRLHPQSKKEVSPGADCAHQDWRALVVTSQPSENAFWNHICTLLVFLRVLVQRPIMRSAPGEPNCVFNVAAVFDVFVNLGLFFTNVSVKCWWIFYCSLKSNNYIRAWA